VNSQMKILVNDGVRPSLGVVRSLGRKGIRVGVLAESSFAPVLHSRYCTRQYLGPAPESEGFVAAVLDILRREHYDAFIPIGYEATLSCAEHRAELETLTRVEIMDEAKIRLAADKRHTHELASAAGVPAPRTVYPASLRDALARAAELEYPIVIKPCRETHGETVRYASSPAELPAVYRRFCEEKGFSQDNLPMLQEFIPGYGCGFFALYQHGVPKRIFMHRRIRENPPSGGVSTCAESFFDPRLKEYGVRLLDSLKWHGVAMVEFRRDSRDHDFKLMEINPRFWGSLDLALAAGVDFPYDLCQVIQGKQLEYSEDYHRAIRFHWPFLDLQHVGRRLSSFGAVVRDALHPSVRSNFWPGDLAPNLFEGLWLARGVARRLKAKVARAFAGPNAGDAKREAITVRDIPSKRLAP